MKECLTCDLLPQYMHGVTSASPIKLCIHTNLHTVSNNRVNRPHNHYVNAYFTQMKTLVCKTKCYPTINYFYERYK